MGHIDKHSPAEMLGRTNRRRIRWCGTPFERVAGAALVALLAGGWVQGVADARPAQELRWTRTAPATSSTRPSGLYPFPNDYFTVPDRSTDTDRRVQFLPDSMPRNAAGVPIDPTEWNRNDGFSPGSAILTVFPASTSRAPAPRPRPTSGSPPTPTRRSSARRHVRKAHPVLAELDQSAPPPTSARSSCVRR